MEGKALEDVVSENGLSSSHEQEGDVRNMGGGLESPPSISPRSISSPSINPPSKYLTY